MSGPTDYSPFKIVNKTYDQAKVTIVTAVTTAVLLLVSLAWNDVVQTTINIYYPKKDNDTIDGKVRYAITITIFVILMQLYVFPYVHQQTEK